MQPKKILLLEDEAYLRGVFVKQLQSAGFNVDGFGTGKEGLAAIQKAPYDLALLDIMLPDTNGLEILKQIKQSVITKDMPVVILTNLGQEILIDQAFKLGAEGYLIKSSITPDQIVQEVKNILQKQPGQPTS